MLSTHMSRWLTVLAYIAPALGVVYLGVHIYNSVGARTAAEPARTWSSAPSARPDPTSPIDGGVTLDLRDVHPSGIIVDNINEPRGDSLNIAGGDNGTASVTFERSPASVPPGGTINVRAGKGGPTGPGGPVKFKDSPVQVGK
jgi:hypothetical protein